MEDMVVHIRELDNENRLLHSIDIENSGCVEAFAQLEGDAHLNLTEMDMNKPLPSVMNTLKNTHAEILENVGQREREREGVIMLMFLPKTIHQRSSVFFSAHVLPIADAEELLKAGVKKLSVFGRNCPVEAKRQNLLLKQCVGCWPTVVNNFVFFCFDEANQREFLQRTAEYIRPALELTPQMARICIVGPPKSGKTTLAQRLALTFNLELVTVSKAIQYLTEVSNKSALCSSVLQHLNAGHCVPDELVVAALEAYVTRALCSVKG